MAFEDAEWSVIRGLKWVVVAVDLYVHIVTAIKQKLGKVWSARCTVKSQGGGGHSWQWPAEQFPGEERWAPEDEVSGRTPEVTPDAGTKAEKHPGKLLRPGRAGETCAECRLEHAVQPLYHPVALEVV